MITLNLIPTQYEEKTKLTKVYLVIKDILLIFLVFVIFITISFLFAKLILKNNYDDLIIENTLVNLNHKKFYSQIKKINSELNDIYQTQNSFYPYSKIFLALNDCMPHNIFLTNLKITSGLGKDKKRLINIKITGKAKTRDDLLKLKNNLEKNELFYNINFPFKNLLKPKNINFQISFNTK